MRQRASYERDRAVAPCVCALRRFLPASFFCPGWRHCMRRSLRSIWRSTPMGRARTCILRMRTYPLCWGRAIGTSSSRIACSHKPMCLQPPLHCSRGRRWRPSSSSTGKPCSSSKPVKTDGSVGRSRRACRCRDPESESRSTICPRWYAPRSVPPASVSFQGR